jgi:hypothetical protein
VDDVMEHPRRDLVDPRQVDVSDRSLGELVSQVGRDVSDLVEAQVELAKLEVRREVGTATRAGRDIAVAGVAGLLALVLLSFAAAWGLAELVQPGWAFLIVGAAWTAVAVALALVARRRMEGFTPVPEQTVDTLKEDVRWIRQQRS